MRFKLARGEAAFRADQQGGGRGVGAAAGGSVGAFDGGEERAAERPGGEQIGQAARGVQQRGR